MKKEETRSDVWRELSDWLKIIIIAAAVGVLISKTLVVNAQVTSGSMENTVMTGSRVLVSRQAYLFHEPERGDIVTFYCPDEPKT